MAYLNLVQNVALQNDNIVQRLFVNNLQQQNLMMLGLGYLVLRDRRRRRQEREQQARRPRRWYTKPWVLGRQMHSQYRNLFEEMDADCQGDYMSYVRMDRESFHELLERVGPRIRVHNR